RRQRLAAPERLVSTGFPGTKDEAWKYTRAAAFLRTPFTLADAATAMVSLPEGPRLVYVDGVFDAGSSTIPVRSVRDVEGAAGRVVGEPAGLGALNLGLARDGASVHAPAEQSQRVVVVPVGSGRGPLGAVRHVVRLDPGARLEWVERFVGAGPGMTSAVTEA